ncbi:putative aldehyde dehydrogenase [Trypoxylus dichotomus]
MEYGLITEDTKAVKEWAKKRSNTICGYGLDTNNPIGQKKTVNDINSGEALMNVYVSDVDVKDNLIELLDKTTTWTDLSYLERTKLMKKFAVQIKQNTDFICKIESVTRGLLPTDTKKYGASFLVEYLEYFANWSYSAKRHNIDKIIVYATDNTSLGVLGFALGPILAHGCKVVFHVEPALSVCVAFLIELSLKAGIPDGTLALFPSNGTIWTPKNLEMAYLFGDIHNEKFNQLEFYNYRQIVAVPNSKTPLVILNDSDLDSACECAVSAIWEYGGLLPWAADTILVQEDVYSEFVEKMKQKLQKIHVGNGIDTLADISYPIPSEIDKLNRMIKDARARGIDVYQPQPQTESTQFQPTLFIGMKVYNNNVIDDYKNVAPAATILAFRSPKEAVALANNSRQGFAASLWSENISLINEVTRQLQVGTIWVNSHGIIKPSVSFTTYKRDGVGYVGGSLGFYEFDDQEHCMRSQDQSEIVPKVILEAKKEQIKWGKLSKSARVDILSKWASDLEQNKSTIVIEDGVNNLIGKIYECITEYLSTNTSETIENFDLRVKRESVGVVVLSGHLHTLNIPLLLGALLEGNTVVMTSKEVEHYKSFLKFLPSGLLFSIETKPFCTGDPHVVFIGRASYACSRFTKNYINLECWKSILGRCTLSRNIWTPIGDSI